MDSAACHMSLPRGPPLSIWAGTSAAAGLLSAFTVISSLYDGAAPPLLGRRAMGEAIREPKRDDHAKLPLQRPAVGEPMPAEVMSI
jgi:hypothetical protein